MVFAYALTTKGFFSDLLRVKKTNVWPKKLNKARSTFEICLQWKLDEKLRYIRKNQTSDKIEFLFTVVENWIELKNFVPMQKLWNVQVLKKASVSSLFLQNNIWKPSERNWCKVKEHQESSRKACLKIRQLEPDMRKEVSYKKTIILKVVGNSSTSKSSPKYVEGMNIFQLLPSIKVLTKPKKKIWQVSWQRPSKVEICSLRLWRVFSRLLLRNPNLKIEVCQN